MKPAFKLMALVVAATAWLQSVWAQPVDHRVSLRLAPTEQAEFLAEMRVMLASVQGIVQGIAASDRDAIARFARVSGNRMARATPAAVRAKMPRAFGELGAPTHMMFEELAVRAETDDMDQLTRHLGETMKQCIACHAAFRAR
jgi:Cytochrome C'